MKVIDYKIEKLSICVTVEYEVWRWKIFRFKKSTEQATLTATRYNNGDLEDVYGPAGNNIHSWSPYWNGVDVYNLMKLALKGVDLKSLKIK